MSESASDTRRPSTGGQSSDQNPPQCEVDMDRVQAPCIEAFRSFYDEQVAPGLFAAGDDSAVDPQELPIYTFFTHGLAHWAVKALEFFPCDRKLFLLASGLDEDELSWVHSHVDRPLHHIPLAIDDKTAWEMLFAVNRTGFGWIDVDCFVRRPELLAELADVPEDAAVSSLWSFDSGTGVRLPYSHCVFVGGKALADPRLRELGIGPATYVYEADPDTPGRLPEWACHRCLTPAQAAAVDRALGTPPEEREETYCNERPFFELLQAFALAAYDLGYRLHEVRNLGLRRDEDHWSDEIIHVSSIAYVTHPRFPFEKLDPEPRKRYGMLLVADYLLLLGFGDDLPAGYGELAEERRLRVVPMLEELVERRLDDESLRTAARALMTHTVSEEEIAADERWSFVRAAAQPVGVAG